MEDLTKTQIVLLCLLVSFVTSIGTGIISYSLLEEAPKTVTQTINRVVERTIETVVSPSEDISSEDGAEVAGVSKEITTVFVTEEDLVTSAIEKNTQSIVRIFYREARSDVLYGLGVIATADGLVVSYKDVVSSSGSYSALFSDGTTYPLTLVHSKKDSNIVAFKIKKDTDDSHTFVPAVFADPSSLKVGQTIIGIGGKDSNAVSVGRVSLLDMVFNNENPEQSSLSSHVAFVETNISLKDNVAGGPLINLSGEIVGLKLSNSILGDTTFTAVGHISPSISSFSTEE